MSRGSTTAWRHRDPTCNHHITMSTIAPQIRPATVEDIDALGRVHATTWRETYRGMVPDDFLDTLTPEKSAGYWMRVFERMRPESLVFALVLDREIIGYTSGGPARNDIPEVDGEIYTLYLLPEHQGNGLGRFMMEHLLAELRATGFQTFGVWVLEENPTRAFYKRMGGRFIRTKEIEIAGETVTEELWIWDRVRPSDITKGSTT